MRNPKRTRLLGMLLAMALLVAACGSGDAAGGDDADGGDAGGDDAAADGDLSGEISVWIMVPGNVEVENVLQDSADDFEAEHEDTTIALEFVPWDSAHDQFVTAIGGGQTPDLAEMGNTWTPEFAELGGLAAIDVDTSDYVDGLVESAVVDDELYGYPWYAGARALIYRADVFEELGLDAPESWEDVLESGDVIAAETDMAPMHVAGDYVHQIAPQIWQAGGEIATLDGETWTAQTDDEAAASAFQFTEDLWERGWSPEGAVQWNSVDVRDAFANGDSAMMVGGGWDLEAILGTDEELEGAVGTALLPEGPGGNRDTFAGGSHLVVFEESENPELAHAFAQHLLEPDQVTSFTEQIGFLPGTESGVEESSAAGDELFGTFTEQLVEHSRSYPPTAAWGPIEGDKVFTNATQRMMTGELDPAGAAAEITDEMNAAFEG